MALECARKGGIVGVRGRLEDATLLALEMEKGHEPGNACGHEQLEQERTRTLQEPPEGPTVQTS